MGMSFMPIKVLKKIFPPIVTGTVILLIGTSLIGSSGMPNWGGGSTCLSSLSTATPVNCSGGRQLPWGSPEYIGLGFLSFVTIVLTELFGSPFLKNASIVFGLLIGCLIAGPAGYIDGGSIRSAPAITFLWYVLTMLDIFPLAHTLF